MAGAGLEDSLLRLLEGYGERYEIKRDVEIGTYRIPATAEFHLSEEKSFFGLASSQLKIKSTEANEHVLFLLEDVFGVEAAERMTALSRAAEQALLRMHKQHGYSFFSIIVLAGAVEEAAAARIKRYRQQSKYEYGWGMARLAVLESVSGRVYTNGDGKDLGRLVLARLKNPSI